MDPQDLVILDRGPFDSLAWMGLLRDERKLTKKEYDVIRDFALHKKWSSYVSRIYLFTCSPEVSLKRETESKLIKRSGTAMNKETLSSLLEQYQTLKLKLRRYPLLPIETSDTETAMATAFRIAEDLIKLFSNR